MIDSFAPALMPAAPLAISLPVWGAPLMGLLALAAVPIVVVYFLKLRRPRQSVPSLVLWQRVMEDQRVNSPFQRFRRNLLLWLQLALLTLVVLACMQPLISGSGGSGEKVPIIVDCSASMGAADADGRTRMQQVKDELREEVDALAGGRSLAIIAAGPRAVRLCDFTNNPTLLAAAIDKLQAQPAPAQLDEALRLADGMTAAQGGRIEEVRLYSDGNLPTPVGGEPDVAVIPFDLPFRVDFRRIGRPLPNLGLVEAAAHRSGSGGWEVFLRVAAGSEAGRADLLLEQDRQPLRPETVVLEAGQSQRLTFRVQASGRTEVTARLQPKQFDALAADDRVRLDLPPARKLRVRCDPGLAAFGFALNGYETIERVETSADLAIVQTADDLRDEPAGLVVGEIPETLADVITLEDGGREVVDWQRSDPLLQHVKLGGVQFLQAPQYKAGAGRQQMEEAGFRVVAEVDGGPLVVRRQDGRNLRYRLLFDPNRSTLTYRVGFPVLVANLIDIGFRQAELSAVRGQRAGVMPPLAVDAPGEYVVRGPEGSEQLLSADEGRLLRGVLADRLGDYTVAKTGGVGDDRDVRSFGVSLLNPLESSLRGVESIVFNEVSVAASEREGGVDRQLWRWLAIAGLAVMALEWWYFHRPAPSPLRP